MPVRRPALGKYLEWNNGSIRVVVAVPRDLHGRLPTKLKQSLNTDSPANAERIKFGVIQQLKNRINAERRKASGAVPPIVQHAMEWRQELEAASDDDHHDTLSLLMGDRAEEIERSDGEEAALTFSKIASGQFTPLSASLETYIGESDLRPRSRDEARRAVRVLAQWCGDAKVAPAVEALSRKVAGRFVSEHLLRTLSRKTVEKYLSFLSGYWKFLVARGIATENPWTGQMQFAGRGKIRKAGFGESSGGKRPYTDDEARKLLYGPAPERLQDLMWIGALSGMRLDEICRLRVSDCADGWFDVNARRDLTGEGKSDASERRVPIHPALKGIIERRSENKVPEAYLIEDLPAPAPAEDGALRERSMPASKQYTRYRRSVGVDERRLGQRQSNVDFHSWRRWFIRKARDAEKSTAWTIADIVGHDTEAMPVGLTMGRYPGRASDEMLKKCVESVIAPSRLKAAA